MKTVTQSGVVFMSTIKEVAQLAGCSVATVSRVINNNGYVKGKTKEKIEKAIQQLNYQPNEAARTLFKQKSKIIGLLLPDISNPFFTLIARGVEDIAVKYGYQVLIGNSDNDSEKVKTYLSTFVSYNCAGLISTALNERDIENILKPIRIPFVFIDRTNIEHGGIATNHFEGGKLQAKIIHKGNAKNVLIVHEDLEISAFKQRIEGVECVLNEYDVKFMKMCAQAIDDNDKLIDCIEQQQIDSIICSNDLLAIKILGLIQQSGYVVPTDIQVVGYDNIPFSEMTFPQITTIDQSAYHLGELAVSQLLNLKGDQTSQLHNEIALLVRKRASTRH